tara:strand:- start:762 stop:992 length:231 start_codon:yes stop_codon:yes gene_type:complete
MVKKSSTLVQRRSARQAYAQAKKTKVGSGKRFAAIKKSAALGGARNPAAVAAAIGRKKYGVKRFAKMAAAGQKRKA